MIKRLAVVFGVVFILVGIMGFIPAVAPVDAETGHAHLLGIFAVNAGHNWVHILSGVAALVAGFMSAAASRTYFRVFGVIYGLVTILGFFVGRGELLGFMAHNVADVALHLAISIVALFLGFANRFRLARAGDHGHHAA